MSKPAPRVAVTRVNNSCVLLELNGHNILTDPWFTEYWHLHRGEPLGLTVESVPSGRVGPTRINAYLLSSGGLRVFFGGEISKVALLESYRADVALLPVNGLRVPLGPRLVMDPARAVEGAKTLGAKVLVAIHDAHAKDPLYFMIRRRGCGKDAEGLGLADPAAPEVVNVLPGQRRELVC